MSSSPLMLAAFATVLASAVPAATQPAGAPNPAHNAQATGFYRVRLGDFIVTVLTDGAVSVPFGKLLQGLAPEAIAERFADAGETSTRETSINAFLIDTGERRILIDAGAGALFGDGCGRLPQTLAAAGYRPEQIDTVLLTHVHGDHSGGLVHDGQRVFPNADVYLAKAELDFWTSDTARDQAKASDKKRFVEGRAALAPYQAAGRIRTFSGPVELFAGVTAIPAPGHTPGHTFYRLESRGRRMLIVGDIVHAAEIQLSDPSVTIDFDIDPAAAAARRKTALAEFASTHELVAASHISFPGLGHVVREGRGYGWVSLPYAADVPEVGQPLSSAPGEQPS